MKHIKKFNESATENGGDFYSKFWLHDLTREFGETSVDKFNSVKPLYGGGTLSQIGYKVLIDDETFSHFILEGTTSNGHFFQPSIILFDINGDGVSHGSLDVKHIDSKDLELHISIKETCKAIDAYLDRYKKS